MSEVHAKKSYSLAPVMSDSDQSVFASQPAPKRRSVGAGGSAFDDSDSSGFESSPPPSVLRAKTKPRKPVRGDDDAGGLEAPSVPRGKARKASKPDADQAAKPAEPAKAPKAPKAPKASKPESASDPAAKPSKAAAKKSKSKKASDGEEEEEGEDEDEEKSKFLDSNDQENHDEVQNMLVDCVQWMEDNMRDNEERPWGANPAVTHVMQSADGCNIFKVFFRPDEPPEPAESNDDDRVAKSSASGSRKRASKQSSRTSGFTATFVVKPVTRGDREWMVECRVSPAANLKHILALKDIELVVEHAENRTMLFLANKDRGGGKLRLPAVNHQVFLALPHFVEGNIERYIYSANLFGGRVSAAPYLDIKFGIRRPNALIGFLSLLTLPDSPVEDTAVLPGEHLTPEDED